MENKMDLRHKELSTGLIAIVTNPDLSREFERGLTIKSIVDHALPMSVVKQAVGAKGIAQAIDIQLTKLVASLNLKWNLSEIQIKTIVEDLMDKYPHETIEDFMLIFKKARQNEFGEIFRLDSAVIFGWVEKYLEEKYQVVEDKLMKEKENHYKPVPVEPSNVDWHKKWLDEVNSFSAKPMLKLSDEEIAREGKERPVKPVYCSPAQDFLNEHRAMILRGQELTVRERHPELTEEEIQQRLNDLRNEAGYSTDVEKITGKHFKIKAKY